MGNLCFVAKHLAGIYFSDIKNQDKFIYLLTNEYKLLAQSVCTEWSTRHELLYFK